MLNKLVPQNSQVTPSQAANAQAYATPELVVPVAPVKRLLLSLFLPTNKTPTFSASLSFSPNSNSRVHASQLNIVVVWKAGKLSVNHFQLLETSYNIGKGFGYWKPKQQNKTKPGIPVCLFFCIGKST